MFEPEGSAGRVLPLGGVGVQSGVQDAFESPACSKETTLQGMSLPCRGQPFSRFGQYAAVIPRAAAGPTGERRAGGPALQSLFAARVGGAYRLCPMWIHLELLADVRSDSLPPSRSVQCSP